MSLFSKIDDKGEGGQKSWKIEWRIMWKTAPLEINKMLPKITYLFILASNGVGVQPIYWCIPIIL